MRISATLAALALLAGPASAQVGIAALPGGTYTETFNAFTGTGFSSTPTTGQINSNNITVSGLSDGNLEFGGTNAAGDFARGAATAGVTTGGVYAFTAGGTATLGVQPGGSDFNPGYFYIRFRNNTGAAITSVSVSYSVFVNNDQARSSSFNLGFASSAAAVTDPLAPTYTEPGGAFSYTSPVAADANGFTNASSPSGALPGVSIPAGGDFVLRFGGGDVAGSGSRDEFGLDNVSVTFTAAAPDQTVTQQGQPPAGYRLLSAPVRDYTVGKLAALNLVQGVAAGTTNPAQYPTAEPVVFPAYAPTTTDPNDTGYVRASSTDQALVPGAGFFWYLFNNDVEPDPASFGGGTSRSFTLASRPFSATGPVNTADVTVTLPASANGFYMVGNPFPNPLGADGVTFPATNTGTLSTTLQAYNPAGGGSFVPIERVATNFIATWQGVFAQVTGGAGGATFTYSAARVDPAQTPTFYGRRAPSSLTLALAGTLESGAPVTDLAAILRFRGDAGPGWDLHDASKLVPPTAEYALLAPVGERDGAAHRQAVLSLRDVLVGSVEVPLAFRATGAGTFTLTPDGLGALPSGASAVLVDRVAGTTAPLVEGQAITFTAPAGDWTERFTLVVSANATSGEGGPDGVSVGRVAPNPASGPARLAVSVATSQRVAVAVFDALGRRVAVAFDGELAPGAGRSISLPTGLAPGLYVARVQGATFTESRQFVVTR